MTLTLKLIIFFVVLIGDVIAAFVISRSLAQQGRGDLVKIILLAFAMSLVVTGVVLFVII